MGFVDGPLPEEPTLEPQGVRVGSVSDDGVYTHRDDYEIEADAHRQAAERYFESEEYKLAKAQAQAREVLDSMGFVLIEEGGSTMLEAMGAEIPDTTARFTMGDYSRVTIDFGLL